MVAAWLVSCAAVFLAVPGLQAAEATPPVLLSAAEQEAIARAFAPDLLFHPLEEFFPMSSMLPLGGAGSPRGADSWRARLAEYRGLSRAEKLHRASLGYRVFSRAPRGEPEVVIEYWCYYVYNAFTVRVGWFPFPVPDNHPHDLERLYLVLTPTSSARGAERPPDDVWARGAFRIKQVIGNAHDGSIPPNQYDVPDG